jgi:DNA-directed RNA polymerases I, II, and III subunit RPABC5
MIIPVKCFTCGSVLADKYLYYVREVNKRKKEKGITDDVYFTPISNEKTIEGQVLDELKLKKICCRRHMLLHVDIE